MRGWHDVTLLVLAFACLSPVVGDEIDRIAVLGCLKQDESAPALERVLEAQPDLCVWIGDNIYADTETSPDFIRDCYATLAAKPGFQALRDRCPWVATWDDHDFGLNDAGGRYRFKHESRDIFRQFWRLEERIPPDHDGVYYATTHATHGKVLQIILLDPRFNREDPGPEADTLGDRQWAWLETALAMPADLRLLVSGYQVLLDAGTGSETWAEFPAARRRLFDLIQRSGAEHLVFLTGDQHYGEVCRMQGAIGYDAVELQFSGVNQIEAPELNTSRVTPVSTSLHSYGLLDIRWRRTAHDVPHLLFHVVDAAESRDEVVYRVNFSELERPTVSGAAAPPPPSAAGRERRLPMAPHAGHAHNDYCHERPLLDALERGFCSVEADVFARDGRLLVGHAVHELRPDRTLAALYLDPLRERLVETANVSAGGAPFTLLVDIKSAGADAYRILAEQLEPLRRFLLPPVGGGAAPLRVIVSGDRPIEAMAADPQRLAGVDGRIEDLGRDDRPAALVPLISDRWGRFFTWVGDGPMPPEERETLRTIVERTHARGQMLRFWATPDDPHFWHELAAAGVDLIGCDDLDRFATFAGSARGVSGAIRHVVVIGVDGLSPEGVRTAATPVLARMRRDGASTLHARAVMPTSSSSNWASMIMGAGPEQHGITTNEWQRTRHEIEPTATASEGLFPTVFGVVRQAYPEAAIGVFHDWNDFGRLVDASNCTVVLDTDGPLDTIARATAFIRERKPVLTFIHLDHVDHAGHMHGWHTPAYQRAVAEADRLIGDVLDAIEAAGMAADTLVIVSSDHGGIRKEHGGATMAEIEIPWIAVGPGVRVGHTIRAAVSQCDTAATIAAALGEAAPACWIGRPVEDAFSEPARE